MSARQPFVCVHCRQPCGLTGHLRRQASDLFGGFDPAWCPSVGAAPVTHGGEVRLGFACPPGHTCYTAATGLAPGQMTRPTARSKRPWRDDPPTHGQLDYLAVLGYDGQAPVTKGQAHDVIDALVKGEDPTVVERELRVRGVRLRDK